MAFIFDSIKNNTYLVFCMCLQFVLMFCYSLVFFPDTDLLAKDLVVCGLIWQSILFVFYLVNFIAFDVENYNTPKSNTPKNKDDEEDTDDDAPAPDSIGPNIFVGILLNVVSCEVVVFAAFCTVWAVSLFECTQSNRSILCYTTWGKHPANVGVAGAILLISISLFFSTLVLYKHHIQSHSFLYRYAENYTAIYSILVSVILKSKLAGYNIKCVAEKNIMWDSNIPEYACFFVLILSQFLVNLYIFLRQPRDKSQSAVRRRTMAHAYTDVGGMHAILIFPRTIAIITVVLNFVNVFELSILLNVVYGLLTVMLCGFLVHPFLCRTLLSKSKKS